LTEVQKIKTYKLIKTNKVKHNKNEVKQKSITINKYQSIDE